MAGESDVPAQWSAWAAREVPDQPDAAAAAALEALAAGLSAADAAALVRFRFGRAVLPDRGALEQARGRAAAAFAEAASLRTGRRLSAAAKQEVLEQLRRRQDVLEAAWVAGYEAVGLRGGPPPRGQPAAPGPSLREFLSEHSIQLLAYSGAFLLLIATLLFDLSGRTPSRFWAVAALDALFAAGAAATYRRPAFAAVSRAYLALAALLLPLTGLAAYLFLDLAAAGLKVPTAVAIAAAGCAVTYGAIAVALKSEAYASVALVALAVAVPAETIDRGLQTGWAGAGLVALGTLLALPSARLGRFTAPQPFGRVAAVLALILPPVGVLIALGAQPGTEAQVPHQLSPLVALVLAVLGTALMLRRFAGTFLMTAAALLLLAPITAWTFGLSQVWGEALSLVAVAVWISAGPRLGATQTLVLRVGAGVVLTFLALVPMAAAAEQWPIAVLAAALLAYITWSGRQAPWLAVALIAGAGAWFETASALLGPHPNANAADFSRVMAPYPLAIGAIALGLRSQLRRRGRLWLVALDGTYVLIGLVLVVVALAGSDLQLAGVLLLLLSALAYTSAFIEAAAIPAAVALAGALAALELLLGARTHAGDAFVLAAAGFGLLVTSTRPLQRTGDLARVHGLGGVGVATAALLAALVVTDHPWALAACALGMAACCGLERSLGGSRLAEYAAVLALSVLGAAAARQLHLKDVAWQTALPAAATVALSARLGHDLRFRQPRTLARWLALGGCLLWLLPVAFQAVDDAAHTAVLALLAGALLAAGIALRSRVAAVSAAAGLLAAGLLALTLLASVLSLAMVFGGLALLLLIAATGLALLRVYLGGAAGAAREAWSAWL